MAAGTRLGVSDKIGFQLDFLNSCETVLQEASDFQKQLLCREKINIDCHVLTFVGVHTEFVKTIVYRYK